MLPQNTKIALVGGGPGGLMLARLLQLQNLDVTVFERDFDASARVQGSPLDLHEESGLAAMQAAGLLDVFKQNFMPGADRMRIMDPKGRIHYSDHDKPAEAFGATHFRPEIDRGVLRKILLESLLPDTVQWNRHFVSMERQGNGWLLHFKEAPAVYADIVVGADGANSKIRTYLTPIKPFYSGITMLEGLIENASEQAPLMNDWLQGGKIMAFGDRQNILMGQKAGGAIGFYASFKADENWTQTSGLNWDNNEEILVWFQKTYPYWAPQWQELFGKASAPFIPRPIYCMPLNQDWPALPNLTLLGDAAHVMPPFAGEGVNMALRDALDLSRALVSDSSVQESIAHYELQMRERAAQSAADSLENGERMHAADVLQTMCGFFTQQPQD